MTQKQWIIQRRNDMNYVDKVVSNSSQQRIFHFGSQLINHQLTNRVVIRAFNTVRSFKIRTVIYSLPFFATRLTTEMVKYYSSFGIFLCKTTNRRAVTPQWYHDSTLSLFIIYHIQYLSDINLADQLIFLQNLFRINCPGLYIIDFVHYPHMYLCQHCLQLWV